MYVYLSWCKGRTGPVEYNNEQNVLNNIIGAHVKPTGESICLPTMLTSLPVQVSIIREITTQVVSKMSDLISHEDNVHKDRNQEKTASDLPSFL